MRIARIVEAERDEVITAVLQRAAGSRERGRAGPGARAGIVAGAQIRSAGICDPRAATPVKIVCMAANETHHPPHAAVVRDGAVEGHTAAVDDRAMRRRSYARHRRRAVHIHYRILLLRQPHAIHGDGDEVIRTRRQRAAQRWQRSGASPVVDCRQRALHHIAGKTRASRARLPRAAIPVIAIRIPPDVARRLSGDVHVEGNVILRHATPYSFHLRSRQSGVGHGIGKKSDLEQPVGIDCRRLSVEVQIQHTRGVRTAVEVRRGFRRRRRGR